MIVLVTKRTDYQRRVGYIVHCSNIPLDTKK